MSAEVGIVVNASGGIVMTILPDARTQLGAPAFNPPDCVQIRLAGEVYAALTGEAELREALAGVVDDNNPDLASALRNPPAPEPDDDDAA